MLVVATAVDTSERTDDFVKSGLNTSQIIRQYYFGFIPWIWGLMYPLFVFIAVIFFTSKMAFQSEVIAIIASGTSYNRWLRPYLIGGIFFAVVLWYGNRYVIPKANEIKWTFQANYIDRGGGGDNKNNFGVCSNCFYRRVDSITYVGIKNYDTASKSANPFFMEKVRNNKVIYNLRAQRIEWDTAKKNWKLYNVVERKIDSTHETVRDTSVMNINLHIVPKDLKHDEYLKDKLTTPELIKYINTEEQRGTEGLNALKVERYRRSATPFTVILLTMIGAIIAGRKIRGGSGFHLAIGLSIAAILIVFDRFSTVFSVNGNMPPIIAAWLPNITFSVITLIFYLRAPK